MTGGVVGQGLDRVDGPAKVSGRATYAYENRPAEPALYGVIVGATIGRGRITRLDTTRVERAPGVRLVLTHHNAPAQGTPDPSEFIPYNRAFPVLSGPNVHHHGEPVALVVADTFERARAAAMLVDADYAAEPGRFDFAANQAQVYAPELVRGLIPTDTALGDFDAAFETSEVRIDESYTTPFEFSQPMEPQAAVALWSGGNLTVHATCQITASARAALARTLRIEEERVHVHTPYVGGGFGSKLGIHSETILAALAARELDQPVKVAQTRQQVFQLVGMRPLSRQRVRLGAGRDGRLLAIAHESNAFTSVVREYSEQIATTTRSLYAAPHRLTRHRLTPLDLQPGEDVRAPGEAPGLLAVESAMDELAHALSMDPVELRIRNEPELDPERGVPFSERRLVECLREGARRFGWERRAPEPARLRDGRWLVGYGMASAIRPHFQAPTKVRVRMAPGGGAGGAVAAVVESDMTDMGTGTYTILTQIAADGLGLPPELVRVELGDSALPRSSGSGGSWGAGNTGTALHRACAELRRQLVAAACGDPSSPLHGLSPGPADAVFSGGRLSVGDASEPLGEIVERLFPDGLAAEGECAFMGADPNYAAYSINTYGAHFAEVGVDADTAEIRLRRMLGVFSVGRVLNAKTARSQLLGGMIWGLSAALHEEAVVDARTGEFVNRDLAHYLVPVHADVPEIDTLVLDGFDGSANPLGAKGLGEVGTCGSGAAVANAVFNATGVRVRDFPVRLDDLLPGLPPPDA